MHATVLKESRKLRAAEGKGAVGFIGIKKKSHRLREFWPDNYLLCV